MSDQPREDMAVTRTDLAEDRTVLANERTFASWLRTGFAATGIALAFNALFVELEPPWVPKAIATGFLLIAVLIFVTAEKRACTVLARLHAHKVRAAKVRNIKVITFLSVAGTAALAAGIWLLRFDGLP